MSYEPEQDVGRALLEALNGVPETHAVLRLMTPLDPKVDMMVSVTVGGRTRLLLIERKQVVFPRDVREMLYRLLHIRSTHDGDDPVLPMVIATTLSPGARKEIREAGVGYFDLSGSLYLPASPAFVFIDRPPRKKQAKQLGSVFHGRKAAVLRVLFDHRDEWVGVKQVADAAEVSPATASETLTELERRDWVTTQGSGPTKQRRLSMATELLDAWTQDVAVRSAPRWRRYYVPDDASMIVRRLAHSAQEVGARYAITGEAAAQAYAPFLSNISQVRCRMSLDIHGVEVLDALDARPVNEGWNLAIHDSRSLSDFSDTRRVDSVCYASPLQVYLDLQHGPGRAKDLAHHLRRDVLKA